MVMFVTTAREMACDAATSRNRIKNFVILTACKSDKMLLRNRLHARLRNRLHARLR